MNRGQIVLMPWRDDWLESKVTKLFIREPWSLIARSQIILAARARQQQGSNRCFRRNEDARLNLPARNPCNVLIALQQNRRHLGTVKKCRQARPLFVHLGGSEAGTIDGMKKCKTACWRAHLLWKAVHGSP